MTPAKGLVLDANILLRAVLGVGARRILTEYEGTVRFYAPDVCFAEAREYIPPLAAKRGFGQSDKVEEGLLFLAKLGEIIEMVDHSLYQEHELSARERISRRDPKDWPTVATALLLGCPIWTEDRDFFGSGIATWTSTNVEIYLRSSE